jgi:hypothetical protein
LEDVLFIIIAIAVCFLTIIADLLQNNILRNILTYFTIILLMIASGLSIYSVMLI